MAIDGGVASWPMLAIVSVVSVMSFLAGQQLGGTSQQVSADAARISRLEENGKTLAVANIELLQRVSKLEAAQLIGLRQLDDLHKSITK